MPDESLTPERLAHARTIWEAAIDLPMGDRPAYVAGVAPDEDLRAFVMKLLAAHESTDNIFSRPLIELVGAVAALPVTSMIGRTLGAYRVTGEIGQGGMGTVYEAVRADDQFTKRVAIKMLRHGADSAEMLRRFGRERQIQAVLSHPNIATLLDAGVTDDGIPYLVLEFVDGLPIDEYCTRNRLGLRARLDLFRQVIGAVDHAHRQLVVHRDLKPNNIFVTSDGVVKLLDFGISKLMGDTDDHNTTAGTRAFTTAYASPEQIRGESMATATDIYSLGVVLYRILAGRNPFDIKDTSPATAWVTICEQTPPPPSEVVTAETAATTEFGSIPRLSKALRGELDAIVMVALRKEPDRRYRSADAMGEDLRRYLRGHPVDARPDSAGYRIRKLVGRNRVGTLALGLATLALVGGTAVSLWQARKAVAERAIADRERRTAERVSVFLQDVLASANPTWSGRGLGPTATIGEAVDVAAKRIDAELADEPEVALKLHQVMAHTYVQLRQADKAALHARRQVELLRSLGATGSALAIGLHDLGAQLRYAGRPDSALPVLREAYDLLEQEGFPVNSEASATLNELGLTLWATGRPREAVPFLKQSLEIGRQLPDSLTRIMIESSNLGNALFAIGDLAGAEQHYREAGRIQVLTNKLETVERAAYLNNLATVLIFTGALEEAERTIKECIAVLTRTLGPANERVATSTVHLARIELATGRSAQALETMHRAAAMLGHLKPQHPERARVENYEAAVLLALNRLPEAEVLARRALETRRQFGAPTDWRIAETEAILARILIARGKKDEAIGLLAHSHQVLRDNMGENHPLTREVERDLRSNTAPLQR